MSRKRKSGGGSRKSGDSDKTGYGRPPKAHQFKPGQSGNPDGKPKGRKNNATLRREILDRKISIRVEGKLRKLSVREVMLTRFAEAGLKGALKSGAYMLDRDDMLDAAQPQKGETVTQEEEEIIAAYMKAHKGGSDDDDR